MPGECEASLAWVRKQVTILGDLPGSAAWSSRFAVPGAWHASMSKGWLLADQSILSACLHLLRREWSLRSFMDFTDTDPCRIGDGRWHGFCWPPLLGR